MREFGIIEPSFNEWSSPIILFPKKDGILRFCLGIRKVNGVNKLDLYPMPRIDDLVEIIGGLRSISILDMCKGYWWVPLTLESKEITITPHDL